jgi:hypothetical protein
MAPRDRSGAWHQPWLAGAWLEQQGFAGRGSPGTSSSLLRTLRGDDVAFVPIRGEGSMLYIAWRLDRPSAARDNFLAVARQTARSVR